MDLDAVETGRERVAGGARIVVKQGGDLVHMQGASFDIGLLAVIGMGVSGRSGRRCRDRRVAA